MPPTIRWARTIDGASIAYHDIGDGPITLVLMNGLDLSSGGVLEQPRYALPAPLLHNMRAHIRQARGRHV